MLTVTCNDEFGNIDFGVTQTLSVKETTLPKRTFEVYKDPKLTPGSPSDLMEMK